MRRCVSLESRNVIGRSGASRRLAKETLLPVVDLSPLVMAIWSEWTIWDIRGRLIEEPRTVTEVGIAVPVQEERPSTCQHVHQRLSRCLRLQKSRQCSEWTRRQLPGGRRQENSRPSGRSAVTAGTGRLRSVPFWRVSRNSARNEARPHRCRVQSAVSGGQLPSSWGGRPRRPAHRIGGRASRSMRLWASVKRKPGSIRPPGNQETTDSHCAKCRRGSLWVPRGRQL